MPSVEVPLWLCWAVAAQFFVTVGAAAVVCYRLGRLERRLPPPLPDADPGW